MSVEDNGGGFKPMIFERRRMNREDRNERQGERGIVDRIINSASSSHERSAVFNHCVWSVGRECPRRAGGERTAGGYSAL